MRGEPWSFFFWGLVGPAAASTIFPQICLSTTICGRVPFFFTTAFSLKYQKESSPLSKLPNGFFVETPLWKASCKACPLNRFVDLPPDKIFFIFPIGADCRHRFFSPAREEFPMRVDYSPFLFLPPPPSSPSNVMSQWRGFPPTGGRKGTFLPPRTFGPFKPLFPDVVKFGMPSSFPSLSLVPRLTHSRISYLAGGDLFSSSQPRMPSFSFALIVSFLRRFISFLFLVRVTATCSRPSPYLPVGGAPSPVADASEPPLFSQVLS